jgi:carbon-monoxide dehydrogenase large subunit
VPPVSTPAATNGQRHRLVGSSVNRVEDRRLLTGAGRYVANLVLPHTAQAVFCRSQVAHGVLRALDVDAARKAPGVVAVITAAELDAVAGPLCPTPPPGLSAPSFPALVPVGGKVRFVGDPMAVVIAESTGEGVDAVELIEAHIDELAPVVNAEQALAPGTPPVFDEVGSNLLYRQVFPYGDADGVIAGIVAAGGTLRHETFRQHRVTNAPMEGHVGLADYTPATGELVYHTANQNPHALRHHLAAMLKMPAHLVQILCPDIGGSFGQKAYPHREDVVVCAASRMLGRPVRWVADRRENLLAGGHAREESLDVEAAVDAHGNLAAFKVRMTTDVGAYPLVTLPATSFAMMARALFPSAYRLEHYSFESVVVSSNKATAVPYRGPWEAETWARERMLDVLARALSRDPVEYRLANLWSDDELPRAMVNGPDLIGITVRETLLQARHRIGYDEFRARQAEGRREGRHLGIGFSCSIDASPGPPNFTSALSAGASPRGQQQADARLETDGSVTLFTSQMPHGQGHETTLAQLAADELSLPLASVRVVYGDTRSTPFNLVGTGGSRAATMASGAVVGVMQALRGQIFDIAAHKLEAATHDLEIVNGRAQVRGVPSRSLGLDDVARIAYFRRGELPPGMAPRVEATFDYTNDGGGWTQATHACVVEVDGETGRVRVLRYLVVADCGPAINPAIVAGQLAGGVVQGIGEVLLEHAAYGDDGQPLATSFADYLLPSAVEVPSIEVYHVHAPPTAAIDFRGVGECGAVGAPAALTNAIEDALVPFGALIVEQYLPPARIAALIGLV